MLGVELVTDRELKTPAKVETLHIMEQMKGLSLYARTYIMTDFVLFFVNSFKKSGVDRQRWESWECF